VDYARAVKNSLTLWVNDGPTLRLMGIQVLLSFIFLVLLGGALWFFFAGLIPQVQAFMAGGEQAYAMIPQLLQSFLTRLIPFLLVIVPLILLEMIIESYILVSIEVRALNVLGFAAPQLTPIKFVKYILLKIWVFIMGLTSWYSRKFFYMFLGIISLFVLAAIFAFISVPIAIIFAFLGAIAYIVYIFVAIYNTIRLSIAGAMYLSSDEGILASVRRTWNFTQGKAVDIFLCILIIVIAVAAVWFAIEIPGFLISSVMGILGVSLVVGTLFSALYSVVVSPIKMVIISFMFPSIYYELVNPEIAPTRAATAPEPAQGDAPIAEPSVAAKPARAKPAARKTVAKKGAPSRKK